MSEPHPEPGERPPPAGRRVLEHPPSSRFEPRAGAPTTAAPRRARALRSIGLVALGLLLGLAGPVLLVGTMATTTGLLFVAGASGLIIGSQLRPRAAVAITLAAALVGDVGAWLFARAEGGVLELPAYAVQIFGVGLLGQVLVAALAAAYASSSIRSGR